MKTLLFITLLFSSVNLFSQVSVQKLSEEKVLSTPLLYSTLTRKVVGDDTTYVYENRNQKYQFQSVVVKVITTHTKEQLAEIAAIGIKVIDSKESVVAAGWTFKRGPAKTLLMENSEALIQIKYKDLLTIIEETK